MTRERTLTALLLAPLAIAALLWLPTPYMAALVAAIFLLGLWEWTRLAGVDDTVSRAAYLAANALLMAALVWASRAELFPFKLMLLFGALWWLVAVAWLLRPTFAAADTGTNRSLKLLAGTLAIVPAWCALTLLHADDAHAGPRWALLAVGVVWAADTVAYFAGRAFGKRKLASRISPGKTWAGAWGGLVGAVVLAVLYAPLIGIGASALPALALLAALTAVFSIAGDLFESLLKRHSGHKDSGTLFPGHGGLMDRLDSIVAALTIFAVGKEWLGL